MKFPLCIVLLLVVGSLSAAELEVGFAEEDVSPPVTEKGKPVWLAGFSQNRRATKTHDPIMARAVVLHDGKTRLAMVSVDVVGLFLPFVEEVRKNLPEMNEVLVSSTHNHEGPDTMGLWGPNAFTSGVDPEVMKRIHDGIVKAVKVADKARKKVNAKIAQVKVPHLVHDSREPFILHDDLVTLQFSEPESNKVVGILVQFNSHPEALGSKNSEMSADFVGYTVAELRKSQGCPVAYFTGTVGGLMGPLGLDLPGPKGEKLTTPFEKTEVYGREIGKASAKSLEKAVPIRLTPFEIRRKPVLIPVSNKLYQIGWQIGVLKRTFFVWNDDPYEKNPTEAKDVSKLGAIRTEVGLLRLGELDIAAIPGEIYPELVLDKVQNPADPGADFPDAAIEPAIYPGIKAKYRMLIGLANDEIGYIIPKRQWDEKSPYCYGRKKAQYGEENSTGPETAPILCRAFRELCEGK